jgi:hypothetical protein
MSSAGGKVWDEQAKAVSASMTAEALRDDLKKRCGKANIAFEELEAWDPTDISCRIGLQSGRERRWLYFLDVDDYERVLAVNFERYTCLSGLEAICSYEDGTIEALIRPVVPSGGGVGLSRSIVTALFGVTPQDVAEAWRRVELKLASPAGQPPTTIAISAASEDFTALFGGVGGAHPLTLKIRTEQISTHDGALDFLRRKSDAVFFQLDLATDVPVGLARVRPPRFRKAKDRPAVPPELAFPRAEYDPAPMSLYWYGRSAVGMPLLQFLAFYQSIEFYYPTYSQAEARRRLRAILKDPTFRGDRDADIGRVLSAIHITRTGTMGDERSQLRATLTECIDPERLRAFLTEDDERAEFFSKSKGLTDRRLSLTSQTADLRQEVAERLYDLRCKIVHTKTDPRTNELELLLPFSKEAEQLDFDIELAQFLSRQVLVAASAFV